MHIVRFDHKRKGITVMQNYSGSCYHLLLRCLRKGPLHYRLRVLDQGYTKS